MIRRRGYVGNAPCDRFGESGRRFVSYALRLRPVLRPLSATVFAMFLELASVSERVSYYLRFYRNYALDRWDALTPMQYGVLLISIGVFGWILMKNAANK